MKSSSTKFEFFALKKLPKKIARFHASVKMLHFARTLEELLQMFFCFLQRFSQLYLNFEEPKNYWRNMMMTLVMRIINLIRFCFANSLFACLNYNHLLVRP